MKVRKNIIWLLVFITITAVFVILEAQGIGLYTMSSGVTLSRTLTLISAIFAGYHLGVITIKGSIKIKRGAPGEVPMLSGLLRAVAVIAAIAAILSLFGVLGSVGTALGAFSGLLLGWSLQAPVSGVAAWVMISVMRPFRIGDRIQLPSLGLVGDVVDISPMYTQLNQVGGAVGSEEAVNRPILIPNAMLFSQVVINYTARQDAAFTLDEVVTRITYDTDWDAAEKILIEAAHEVTGDIIKQTGQEPYVRSDMYDYGVYMRLRFMTKATDRPRITYEIIKRIFQGFQRSARVDFAIPFVYSFRKGVQASARYEEAETQKTTTDIPLSQIIMTSAEEKQFLSDAQEIAELSNRIKEEGLIQPVVLAKTDQGTYRIIAGHMRVEACKRLGWRSLPAIIKADNREHKPT
ncbi:MAG: mechanosensitive ion channel [Anaerolineae bacterium]|nr:mechanosensitive ion channel [Anaerolineae bacterium]